MTHGHPRLRIMTPSGDAEWVEVPPEIVAAARLLRYDPPAFFTVAGSRPVPLSQLVLSRTRPTGVLRALDLMARAARGEVPRRKPVAVRSRDGGASLVVDGNSTTMVAVAAGWPDLPCTDVLDEPVV